MPKLKSLALLGFELDARAADAPATAATWASPLNTLVPALTALTVAGSMLHLDQLATLVRALAPLKGLCSLTLGRITEAIRVPVWRGRPDVMRCLAQMTQLATLDISFVQQAPRKAREQGQGPRPLSYTSFRRDIDVARCVPSSLVSLCFTYQALHEETPQLIAGLQAASTLRELNLHACVPSAHYNDLLSVLPRTLTALTAPYMDASDARPMAACAALLGSALAARTPSLCELTLCVLESAEEVDFAQCLLELGSHVTALTSMSKLTVRDWFDEPLTQFTDEVNGALLTLLRNLPYLRCVNITDGIVTAFEKAMLVKSFLRDPAQHPPPRSCIGQSTQQVDASPQQVDASPIAVSAPSNAGTVLTCVPGHMQVHRVCCCQWR
jgi:hypothetical protein